MNEKFTGKSRDNVYLPVDQATPRDSLTNNAHPAGWTHQDLLNTPQAKERSSLKLPGLAAPARAPKGITKLLRFGRTFINLLRRPEVVNDLPIHLQMESTDACNLNCTTCSRDIFIKKARLLDEKIWKKVIDEVRPTNINVSGIGEPFLHPDIFAIVKYAKGKGSIINCATNFTRIHGRYREVIDSGISQLKVSIDSTNRETFKSIRGEDCFDEIIDNIRNIVNIRNDLKKTTPAIRFNFALQHLNYKQAPELIDLAAEIGVEGIYFQYLEYVDMEGRKGMLTGDMTKESLLEVLKETEKRAAEKGILTNLDIWWRDYDIFWNKMQPIDEFQPNNKQCYFPWFSTWVSADGWIRPCPIMPWTLDEGRMGNLAQQSFPEIWNGPRYRELRAALARGERPTRSCKTCIPQSLHNIIFLQKKLLPKK
jgi:radical SAM protein with 4Fe4S-binding SPASM domain